MTDSYAIAALGKTTAKLYRFHVRVPRRLRQDRLSNVLKDLRLETSPCEN